MLTTLNKLNISLFKLEDPNYLYETLMYNMVKIDLVVWEELGVTDFNA